MRQPPRQRANRALCPATSRLRVSPTKCAVHPKPSTTVHVTLRHTPLLRRITRSDTRKKALHPLDILGANSQRRTCISRAAPTSSLTEPHWLSTLLYRRSAALAAALRARSDGLADKGEADGGCRHGGCGLRGQGGDTLTPPAQLSQPAALLQRSLQLGFCSAANKSLSAECCAQTPGKIQTWGERAEAGAQAASIGSQSALSPSSVRSSSSAAHRLRAAGAERGAVWCAQDKPINLLAPTSPDVRHPSPHHLSQHLPPLAC